MKNKNSLSNDFAQMRDNPAIYLDLLQEEPTRFPAEIESLYKDLLRNIRTIIESPKKIEPREVIPWELQKIVNDYCLAEFFSPNEYEKIIDAWIERLNKLATTHNEDNHILQHIAEMQDDHFYRTKYIKKQETPTVLHKAEFRIVSYDGGYYSSQQNSYRIKLLDKKEFKLGQERGMFDYVSEKFIEDIKNMRRQNVKTIKANRYYRLMSTELIRIHAAERDLHDLIAKRQQVGLGTKPATPKSTAKTAKTATPS